MSIKKCIKKTGNFILKCIFVPLYKKSRITKGTKITLSMVVRNEEGRYLEEVLYDCIEYIDYAVIIDDASTDNTISICENILKDVPHIIIKNKESKFKNEYTLRKQQWQETIKTNPDWILILDADEVFEENFKYKVKNLVKNSNVDAYYFRLYDMWNKNQYRSDNLWKAHEIYSPFLFRYRRNINYFFKKTKQHCGRMPLNVRYFPYEKSEYRIKHYGWSRKSDRMLKYERYIKLDGDGKCGSMEQYTSILDNNPNLIDFDTLERNNNE